jgi:RHH-type proline utilization regulon transcriptional repressor/proline dehydrogenase/delta 1-pyrroline-5-carboxylate dehydrogenase
MDQAIDFVNQTGYGLTSGLESLDDREQRHWRDRVKAGNLYINRATTGAVVLRQPFGGMGKSAFGPGIKAGGPNYVAQLMRFSDVGPVRGSDRVSNAVLSRLCEDLKSNDNYVGTRIATADIGQICHAIRSYDLAMQEEFGVLHDHFRLVGQDNLRRYLAVRDMRIRVHPDDSAFELFGRVAAAKAAGCRITVSYPDGFDSPALQALEHITETWGGDIEFVEESDQALVAVIERRQTDRIRYAQHERVPDAVLQAVSDTGVFIARSPVLAAGRIELLWYLMEQSISHDYHRYGSLGGHVRPDVAEHPG